MTATAKVKDVKFYNLTPIIAEEIKKNYGKEIGIVKFANWDIYRNKKYYTLIWLKDINLIEPTKVKRSNGSGWIVLDN